MHVGECHVGVFNAPTPFKLAPLLNLHARTGHVQDECRVDGRFRPLPFRHGDPFCFSVQEYPFCRHASHQCNQAGQGAIRAPKFFAVDHKMCPQGIEDGIRLNIRRIRSGVGFRECKCRNFFSRDSWEECLFLFLVSEHKNRHGNSDGLGNGHGEGQSITPAGHQHQHPPVIGIGKSQPTIFFGYLHPEGAKFQQAFEYILRNFFGSFNFVRVNMLLQKLFNFLAIVLADFLFLDRFLRWKE